MTTLLKYVSLAELYTFAIAALIFSFFPNLISYKQYMILLGILSLVIVFYFFTYFDFVRDAVVKSTLFSSLIILLYWFTSYLYQTESTRYHSFFLVLIGQFLPISILAGIVSKVNVVQDEIKRFAPIMSLLFGVLSFRTAFFPSAITSGGFAMDYTGLNYQTISYMAAYGASMTIYYLLAYDELDWPLCFKSRKVKTFMTISLFLNLVTIFISGGRGGLVLYVVLMSIYLYNKKKYNDENILQQIILVFVMIGGVVLCLYFAKTSSIQTNGFNRILQMVYENDTNGRSELKNIALSVFFDSPICGHGLGSVFYEVGEYSHNILLDIMVEMGIIGIIGVLLLFIFIVRKFRTLIFSSKSNLIWELIFVDGLVMSLFSGYYLATCPLIWTFFFLLYYPKSVD